MGKLHFITFANTQYMVPSRILEQAQSFELFDSIKAYTEYDLLEFLQKHFQFIKNNLMGFGLYIWKPKIILDRLHEMEDGDLLLYCDAGCHLNVKGKKRFLDYIEMLKKKELLSFLATDYYIANTFVKNDAVMSYYPEFHNEKHTAMYAGVVFLRKTKETVSLIKEWLDLCENYHFLDKSPSVLYPEVPGFLGQDCDNGLYALCVYKHKSIVEFIGCEETNIYTQSGEQYYGIQDWSFLDDYPIQCRRDRPPRDYYLNRR